MELNGQHLLGVAENGVQNRGASSMGWALSCRVLARVALDFAEALPQESAGCQVFAWHAGELALRCIGDEGVSGEAEFRRCRDLLIVWIRLGSERGWVRSDRMNEWLRDLTAVGEEMSLEVENRTLQKPHLNQVRRRGWAFGARSRCGESRDT